MDVMARVAKIQSKSIEHTKSVSVAFKLHMHTYNKSLQASKLHPNLFYQLHLFVYFHKVVPTYFLIRNIWRLLNKG